ncbi:hypothetical protein ESCO_006680 [Escovopsis weberi]|uniref:Protein kinase domain-containing protein n=1 Tax=Escovopsis weberi TaxID=150374 RepID=A0A0M8NAL4_ESCWE|nr:hypothetical protein ESCO_006680 [Escovopsis weberi]
MERLFPELQIQRRDVPAHAGDDFRNMLTYQSAIIRGEDTVLFNNADSLAPDMADRIRTFLPADHPPNHPRNWLFAKYRDPREADLREREDVREVIPDQMWEGFELEWVKVLGEGGFGIATLWRAYYDDDNSYENVVIKIPHSTDIRGEAEWHLRYDGASHIVQFLDIQEKARDIRREHFPGVEFQWEEDFDWRAMNVIMLEYAEYGNVYEMMQKVSYFNITFPNRCLWEIWECQVPMTHDVHFDIEEQNNWDELVMGAGADDFKGEDLSKGHPIAGRYGTWTNLFHIGQVMEGIITKVYGFHPMLGIAYPNLDGTQTDKTYGWRLMKPAYNGVERELKDLILQCMYEKPSSRPTLDYLLKKMAARKARGFDESPDQVKRFWENLANLRRDSQHPPPDHDDDDDDDGGPPPDLSHGDDDKEPTNPQTPSDSPHSEEAGMATAWEQPQPSYAQDAPAHSPANNRRRGSSSSSVSLGSPITSGTALATSVLRDHLVAQFTSMPSSSETFVSCTEALVPSSSRGAKRKLRLLDDDFSDEVAAKRSRTGGQPWAADAMKNQAQLGRGTRQRLERMNTD